MNHLAKESSLYLQQHARNPVDWYPWCNEAWEKARKEKKLVLISIGYSSCHWCHVMEHETFTDANAAAIMNRDFICIKVDREERPDIDQTYMAAVQLMTGSGGWPLNCFALPDGRPIYGGTYFPNANWRDILIKLNEFYKNDPNRANEYADELAKGMAISEKFSPTAPEEFTPVLLDEMIAKWKNTLDIVDGGPNRSPKFPMPSNYEFLLRYAVRKKDNSLLDQIKVTLKKMAYGGIYDQIAGGFARYSTDTLWKIPHFEKMLYDNAQLIGLYSKAFKYFKDDLYKNIVYETSNFLYNEMSDQNGGYFSSYDADSEGEEGKYYVWTEEELKQIPLSSVPDGNAYNLLADYYNINSYGHWEHGNYVLIRKDDDNTLAIKHKLDEEELKQFISEAKQTLLKKRNERVKPSLDKKIITSWNGLTISGLCEAYEAFEDELFLDRAKEATYSLLTNCTSETGKLLHVESQKGKLSIGYLEDYAFTITALIRMYECTFEEHYIVKAKKFADDAIELFYDEETALFWFNSSLNNSLFTRKKEIHDNVIAASNSEMGKACFYLSRYFEDEKTETIAKKMMRLIASDMALYGPSYSNWAILYTDMVYSFKEVVITGPDCIQNKRQLSKKYTSGLVFAGGTAKSELPLLKDRISSSENKIYICENKSCRLPIHKLEEVEI